MIYILDKNITRCAQALDDKSLDRMIKDIAHVLCNVHRDIEFDNHYMYVTNIPLPPKAGYEKWSKWARECKANYLYFVDLLCQCITEYHERINYGMKVSATNNTYKKYFPILLWTRSNVPNLDKEINSIENNHIQLRGFNQNYKPFPLFMPKKYILYEIIPHPLKSAKGIIGPAALIESYRNYYKAKITKDAKWTQRAIPNFIKIGENNA